MPNINIKTGVHFGCLSANKIDQEIYHSIFDQVESANYAALTSEEQDCDDLHIMEPNGEWDYENVTGVLFWLGGAPNLFITESPVKVMRSACSPCVPNAGFLDNREDDITGVECYDVPDDWYL